MSDLENRGDAFEKKFAHDEDLKFKVEARCCKLIGIWAAEKLGIQDKSNVDAYAKEVVVSNLEEIGLDDVKRKVMGDFETKGAEVTESEFDEKLAQCLAEAKEQIMTEIE
ncbi:MAG: DUF1476 domain-containing protein [Bdellovibrionales bacterium]